MTIDLHQSIQEQIATYSKTYPISKMKSTADLSKLLEVIHLKSSPKQAEDLTNDVTHVYLLNSYSNVLREQTKEKPIMAQKEYLEHLKELMLKDLEKVNTSGEVPLVAYPGLLSSNVLFMLNTQVVQHWYGSYKTSLKQPTAADPKGLERLNRIKESYTAKLRAGNKGLSKGTLMLNYANGGCLLFTSPKRDEVVVLYLVNSRKIEFQQKLSYEKEVKKESIGGSVSGTTLKSLKETLRNFTNNSIDKEYWSEVLKIVNENI